MRTFVFLAAVLLISTGFAPTPTWPAQTLRYFNDAAGQIEISEQAVKDGFAAFGNGDAEEIAAAVEALQAAGEHFGDNKAPAALAPLAAAAHYAAETCASTLDYFSTLPEDAATSPFTLPTLIALRSECMSALQATRMESARAVAAVGAWPPASK